MLILSLTRSTSCLCYRRKVADSPAVKKEESSVNVNLTVILINWCVILLNVKVKVLFDVSRVIQLIPDLQVRWSETLSDYSQHHTLMTSWQTLYFPCRESRSCEETLGETFFSITVNFSQHCFHVSVCLKRFLIDLCCCCKQCEFSIEESGVSCHCCTIEQVLYSLTLLSLHRVVQMCESACFSRTRPGSGTSDSAGLKESSDMEKFKQVSHCCSQSALGEKCVIF